MRDLLPLLASSGTRPGAEVEAHLTECAACRSELEFLGAASRALSIGPTVDAARISRAIPAYRSVAAPDPKVVPIGSRRRSSTLWRIAAAGLLVVGAGAAIAVQEMDITGVDRPVVASVEPAAPAPDAAADSPPASVKVDAAALPARQPSLPRPADNRAELTFGGGLGDLSDDDLIALLAALDETEGLTSVDPETVFPVMTLDGEEET